MCSLSAVFPTDLGNELFLAAKVVGNTLGALVEKVASAQGISIYKSCCIH